MSSSVAIILCRNGQTFHGRYDGTVDVLRPFLYLTPQERDGVFNLRGKDEPQWESCACPPETHEWAWADTDYANLQFPVRVCCAHRLVKHQWRHYPMDQPLLKEIQTLRASLLRYENTPWEVPWEPDWTTSEGPTDYAQEAP